MHFIALGDMRSVKHEEPLKKGQTSSRGPDAPWESVHLSTPLFDFNLILPGGCGQETQETSR